MQDCHWSASDILKKVDDGDKSLAGGMLQSEMNRLSPDDFKRLANEMVTLSKNDSNDSNDVQLEFDDQNNVKSVSINDGYLWDTVLARKGRLTPLSITAVLNGDCRLD